MSALVLLGLANAGCAAVLAVPAWLVTRYARRPALAHALWLLVLVKLITPPLFRPSMAWLPASAPALARFEEAVVPQPQQAFGFGPAGIPLPTVVPNDILFAPAPAPAPQALAVVGAEGPGAPTVDVQLTELAADPVESAPADPVEGLLTFAGIVWLAGAVIAWGWALFHVARFQSLLAHAVPAPQGLQIQLDKLAHDMGVGHRPGLWLLPGPLPPLVWAALGSVRIFFPAGLLDRLGEEERASLLAHELAHVARRDHWVRWLEVIVAGLYWWCPLAWWVRAQLHEAEEECCDCEVIAGIAPRTYATAILQTVDFLAEARPRLPAMASGLGGARLLKQRLTRIFESGVGGKLGLLGHLLAISLALLLLPWLPTFVRAEKDPPGDAPSEAHPIPEGSKRGEVVAAPDADELTSFATPAIDVVNPSWEFFSVAFSPDGKRAVAGGGMVDRPGEIHVWDVETRKPTWLGREMRGVASVNFTPDSKSLFWSGWDRLLRRRDLDAGRELYSISLSGLASSAISADGMLLATASDSQQVQLWDARTGKAETTLQADPINYYCVSFSHKGLVVAAGGGGWQEGGGGPVLLWDVKTRRPLGRLAGHTRAVLGIAFAPDDELVATAGVDGQVRLWNLAARREVKRLAGHTSVVKGLAFSPDGKVLASGSWDNTIRLWDVSAGKELAVLTGHPGKVREVAFSPDGKLLLSGGEMRSVKLWDVAARKEVATLSSSGRAQLTPFLAGTLSPDRRTLALGTDAGPVQLRDARTGDLLKTLIGHDEVTALAFGTDGKILATGSPDKLIKLWDVASGKEQRTLEGHKSWVYSLAFAPDNKTLASGSYDRSVRLWDAQTGKERHVLKGHPASVRAVVFSPDGRTLYSAGADRMVRLWDVANGEAKGSWSGHEGTIRALAFAPDGRTLASVGEDGAALLWNVSEGKVRMKLTGPVAEYVSVAFSPGGRTLAAGSATGMVQIWDAEGGSSLAQLWGHSDAVNAVAYAPGARMLTTAGRDKRLCLWQGQPGPIRAFVGHKGPVRQAVFSPDGKLILSGGGWPEGDKTLRLWDALTGKELRRFSPEAQVLACGFTPDGKRVLSGCDNGQVQVWDAATGEKMRTLEKAKGEVSTLAVSPDGKYVLAAGADRLVRLWNLENGELIHTCSGHTDMVRGTAWLPNSKRFVSAARDRTLRLWDVSSGKEVRKYAPVEGGVEGVAVLPDGKRLFAATGKNCRVFDIESGKELLKVGDHRFGTTGVAVSPDGRSGLSCGYDGGVCLWDLETGKERGIYRGHREWVWSVAFSPDGKRFLSTGGGGQQKGVFVPGQDWAIRMWDVPR